MMSPKNPELGHRETEGLGHSWAHELKCQQLLQTPSHVEADVMKGTQKPCVSRSFERESGNEKLANVQETEKRGILLKYKSGHVTFWLKTFPFPLILE